jgi:ribonuclease HI
MIQIYTDGSMNKGYGGSAFVVVEQGKITKRAGKRLRPPTTNSRAELVAMCLALKWCAEQEKPVEIFTDSQYVIRCAKSGAAWKKAGWKNTSGHVANRDLVEDLLHLLEQCRSVTIQWVKGHAGDLFNEAADKAANYFSALRDS